MRKCAIVIEFLAPDDATDEELYDVLTEAEATVDRGYVSDGFNVSRTLATAVFGSPGGDENLLGENELDTFAMTKMAPALSLLVPGVDYEKSVCGNCGKDKHTPDELRDCLALLTWTPEPEEAPPLGPSRAAEYRESVPGADSKFSPGPCALHPAYEADYCPRCGTATVIS